MKSPFGFALAALLFLNAHVVVAQSRAETLNLAFTTIDVPGAAYTSVNAINTAGNLTGDYGLTSTAQPLGFFYQRGTFSRFRYPGSYVTFGQGINDSDEVIGWSINSSYTAAVSFIYAGGKFTKIIRAPGDSATFAQGINNVGVITGGDGALEGTHGFVLNYTTIEPSGVFVYVYATGMNKAGEIAGFTIGPSMGFSYKNGQYQTISIPSANTIWVFGINDSGIVVGYDSQCSITACVLGFATRNGKVLTINYPGAMSTAVHGINNKGQLSGSYTLDNLTWHGFVTSPITASFQ